LTNPLYPVKTSMSTFDAPLYDLVGVGFGPANIALAGVLIEKWEDPSDAVPRKILFLEKQDAFRWHPGMLLPNTRMQISYLKDLATLRNPRSPITFLSYLHETGRLLQFVNRGMSTPSRREYADYLSWAARYVQDHGTETLFSKDVVQLGDGADGSAHVHFRDTVTGEVSIVRTKNLVISPGGRSRIPAPLRALDDIPHVLHSSTYATAIGPILLRASSGMTSPLRIAVVGAGQSASEVLIDLYERLHAIPAPGDGRHRVEMILRKGCIKPSDDTPFANEIFDPASTDVMFGLPSRHARELVIGEYGSTNYGVTNPRTINALYELLYAKNVEESIAARDGTPSAKPLIALCPYTYIISASASGTCASPIALTLHDVLGRSSPRTEMYDVVICGTGYDRTAWIELLASGSLGTRFGLDRKVRAQTVELVPALDEERVVTRAPERSATPRSRSSSLSSGTVSDLAVSAEEQEVVRRLFVSRAYRLLPHDDALVPRVYLQGCLERTHGLSDTLLSVMGPKAGEIVEDLMCTQPPGPYTYT
ncbi:L-lysine 6-monooxygenase (NADPH-requiring)-domain-containing protein, partial [Vararia minispora EC-137]